MRGALKIEPSVDLLLEGWHGRQIAEEGMTRHEKMIIRMKGKI